MKKKAVGVAELKAKLSEYLRAARRGHDVTVYDRDQPIARIVPYEAASGIVIREPLVKYERLGDIPLPPVEPLEVDVVALLREDRDRR